jgi:hypothetical protein
MEFRRTQILLEDGRRFGDAMEAWQQNDFEALDSGAYRHAYLERPRGHSKTGDIATEAVGELVLGPKGQRLYCVAADEDQGRLLFDDVAGKFQRNPALRRLVRITQKEILVLAGGARLRVLNSDAPSQYGLRPDWICCDEVAEWKRRDLWDSLWTATGKRSKCGVICISTAGWDKASVCWEIRENAERESDWFFSPRGQCASWIDPAWLGQQRRTLPAHVYARLHESRWVDGVGAWLSSQQVDDVFSLESPPPGGGVRSRGLDIGISRDRGVLCEIEQIGALVCVRSVTTYTPTKQSRVHLQDIEDDVLALEARHRCPLVLDPWQGIGLSQRLQGEGVETREYQFSGDGRRKLFAALLDLVTTGRLRAPRHDLLRRELLSLEAKQSASGWRVDHQRGGFDDHVVALGLAIQGLPPVGAGDMAFAPSAGPSRSAVATRGPWAASPYLTIPDASGTVTAPGEPENDLYRRVDWSRPQW